MKNRFRAPSRNDFPDQDRYPGGRVTPPVAGAFRFAKAVAFSRIPR